MTNYICAKCGKIFNQKSHYDAHLARKNSCENKLLNQIIEQKVRDALSKIPTKLKMIDLFAGTGAFSIAFQQTQRVDVVFANDISPASKESYDANHTVKLTLQDINEYPIATIPYFDILMAGFACQPFSVAGRQEGFDDSRANVFWTIMRIVDHHKPQCIVLENVKNLTTHDNGNTFRVILSNLTKRGYNVVYNVLNTAQITGVPQHRERIYIVAVKSKRVFNEFDLDFPDVPKRPLSDFFDQSVADKYYYTSASSTWKLLESAVKKQNTIYQYRRVYVRENKSSECPTLTANMGMGGHNVPIIRDAKGIRKLTPRECFNLQGFPPSYILPQLSDAKLYKLAGNAVSFPVVKLIADRLIPLLMAK